MHGIRSPLDAKRAQREAIDRALAVDLSATDLRVLMALFKLMPLYDRLEDRVSNLQLREATGISDDRRVRRSIKRLAELGVIERELGGSTAAGGRIASLFRFPLTTGATDPGSVMPPGVSPTPDPGSVLAVTGGPHVPASEVLSEASPEVRRVKRTTGYQPGHTATGPATPYPNPFELDDDGRAVRVG